MIYSKLKSSISFSMLSLFIIIIAITISTQINVISSQKLEELQQQQQSKSFDNSFNLFKKYLLKNFTNENNNEKELKLLLEKLQYTILKSRNSECLVSKHPTVDINNYETFNFNKFKLNKFLNQTNFKLLWNDYKSQLNSNSNNNQSSNINDLQIQLINLIDNSVCSFFFCCI